MVSIHEAMEQMCISIAKAGIVSRLNTRCNIIAASTFNGYKNVDRAENEDLTKMTNLSTPLLSRFDLIFVIRDIKNDNEDEIINFMFDKYNEKKVNN